MNNKCPVLQGDADFDNMLQSMGFKLENKIVIFLTICVLVRLVIAGLANQYYDAKYTPYITLIGAIIAILILVPKLGQNQWWFRSLHILIASLIIYKSYGQITTDKRDRMIAYLLFFDVFLGLNTLIRAYMTC